MKFITAALLFLLTIPGLAAPKPAFEIFDIEGAFDVHPRSINDNGAISGTVATETRGELGFIKNGNQVTLLSVPGSFRTQAWGIDNEGRVAGTFTNDSEPFSTRKGFIYENGQYTTVIHPQGITYYGTQLYGISEGRAVGLFVDSTFIQHGILYANGQFTLIDVPGASSTTPLGINAAGRVVGYYQNASSDWQTIHGFSWQNGQFETIDFPRPGAITALYALNSDTIVGGVGGACLFEAFILRHGKFQLLDLPGVNVWGINEAGMIVGDYGRNRGFIAK